MNSLILKIEYLLLIFIALFFQSCDIIKDHNFNKKIEIVENVTTFEQDSINSIKRFEIGLEKALLKSNANFDKNKYFEEYDELIDSIPFRVEINLDYHFVNSEPHLIIKQFNPSDISITIFSKDKGKFNKRFSEKQWSLSHEQDYIKDVNGDGIKDFIIVHYSPSGCCLRYLNKVYLFDNSLKLFSENIEFMNPTFSPTEKIIRGICYGHSGETELYKYKWNNKQVDTLEYISYQKNENEVKTGKFVVSKKQFIEENSDIIKIINQLPKEYYQINDIDWFIGF